MSCSPYRRAGDPGVSQAPAASEDGNGDMWLVLALLWLASLARVVVGIVAAEAFASEGTLALAAAVGLPVAAVVSWRQASRARTRGAHG